MNRNGSPRTSTRSLESTRRRTRRPSRRPTASWLGSGTRIRTRATRPLRPSSRKSARPTPSCPMTRIVSVMTRSARWPAAGHASPPDRAARAASRISSGPSAVVAASVAAAITCASRPPACPAVGLVSRTSSPASSAAAAVALASGATPTVRPSAPLATLSRRHPPLKRVGPCARSCPSPSARPLTARP